MMHFRFDVKSLCTINKIKTETSDKIITVTIMIILR